MHELAELDAIRERERSATPGPWGWYGNTDTQDIYLSTKHWGRYVVMQFRRWGLRGAKPAFAVGRTWEPDPQGAQDFGPNGRMAGADSMVITSAGEVTGADRLVGFVAAPGATARSDPRVYRADITGIRNPDAEFIAHSREDVRRLLGIVDRLLALAGEWDAKGAEIWGQIGLLECDGALAGFKAVGAAAHKAHAQAIREAILGAPATAEGQAGAA